MNKEDRVLIIDDFLANGCALMGFLQPESLAIVEDMTADGEIVFRK